MLHRILLILLLIAGLAIGVYLIGQRTGFFSRAGVSTAPKNIKITNISDNSFTVSWVTDKATTGFVSVENIASGSASFLDERDKGVNRDRLTHYVAVDNLEPATGYSFKIHSGADVYDNHGKPFTQTTAPAAEKPPAPPDPVFGKVVNEKGTAPEEALVYINIGRNSSLATFTRDGGRWLLTLNNARTADLQNYSTVDDTDQIDITVAADGGSGQKQIRAAGRAGPVVVTLQPAPDSGSIFGNLQDLNGDGVVNVFDFALSIKQVVFK